MNEAEWQIEYAKRPQMVYLRLSSWRGMSIGATHWYGEMVNDKYVTVRMMYPLTTSQALDLTKKHNAGSLVGADYFYEEGDEVSSFDTKAQIIEQAVNTWRELFPEQNILVLGDPVICEIPLTLDGAYK